MVTALFKGGGGGGQKRGVDREKKVCFQALSQLLS